MSRSATLRPSPAAGWLVGLVLAALVNLAVIVALAPAPPREPAPEPPLVAMTLAQVPPPPPPPPSPVVAAAASVPEPAAAPESAAMPALDLAPAGDAAMALLALDLPPAPLPALVMPRPPAPPAVIVADAPVSAGGGDRAATLIDTPDLDRFYPHIARRRQIEGRTLLRLRIGADGRVESVRLVASEPPGVFELAADPLARALRFVPAQHEGVAVASEQPFELRWRLR